MTTSTTYPDAHPETSTFDGRVVRGSVDQTLTNIRSGAGNGSSDTDATYQAPRLVASTTTNQFAALYRAIWLFDTSAIPADATINSATLRLYCTAKTTGLGTPELDIVGSNPASNTAVANADYGNVNTTVHGSIAGASVSTSAYNDITLATTAITKAGITKLGGRLNWDTDNSFTGSWSSGAGSGFTLVCADNGSNKPELVVVYTAAGGTRRVMVIS